MKPKRRFTVGSVTGYPITDVNSGETAGNRAPQTIWYVHDSTYGYLIVREFRGKIGELKARNMAARLNGDPMRLPDASRAPKCRRGHPYDADNTYVNPTTGQWVCRTCRNYKQRLGREAKRAA